MQAAELQGQVGSFEAFAEACVQELRRLSILAGEPFQLPALPQADPQVPSPLSTFMVDAEPTSHQCFLESCPTPCLAC